MLDRLGLDVALVLPFDDRLANLEPEAFVESILAGQLRATGVLLGHDTRFGKAGRGDLRLLSELGERFGFEACSVPVVELDDRPVSSTRIRELLQAGDLRAAERLLGRCVSLFGTVVRGTGRGAEIGYATANLDLRLPALLPEGVYATWADLDGAALPSVTNIGRPPSLRPDGDTYLSDEVAVETHILDHSGDLYGREMEVRFVDFIRPEKVFDSPEALAAAIARDVEAGRARLRDADKSGEPR